jgi:putative DNA primase/helicase
LAFVQSEIAGAHVRRIVFLRGQGMVIQNIEESIFRALKGHGKPHDFMARCPAHTDDNPSLHVTVKEGKTLLHCFAGCSQDAVIEALTDRGLWPKPERLNGPRPRPQAASVAATYDYVTADSKLAHQTLRLEPKSFRQRRPAPEAGLWIWGLGAGEFMRMGPAKDWQTFKEERFAEWPPGKEKTRFDAANLVLYRLPEVTEAVKAGKVIFICEGEKDANNICALGFAATCNAMGAGRGKWLPNYNETLRDADVVLLPHNDDVGRDHGNRIAASIHGIAKRIRVLDIAKEWPECGEGQDISDWLAAGGAAPKLTALIGALSEWSPSPARLRPLSLAEFLSKQIKPREMLLAPVILEKGLVMLYASRGTGKTHIALGIGYAVATGTKFLKWESPSPRRVLLIDGEMPARALQERLAQIVAGAAGAEIDPDMLKVLAGDLIEEGGIGNLASPEVQAELEAHLGGVALLILDNLSSLTAVIRDNDAESWNPIQDWLLRLRRRGVSVLIVHHAGKGGQQRGTSRREDVLDTSISLRRPPDYDPSEGARFEVHLDKARGVFGDDAKPFEARLMEQAGAAVWTMREIEHVHMARVRAMHADGMSVRDMADELGISKSAVHRLVKKIEEEKQAGG